ncbi:hypothetical protein EJV47_02080 [Hymenobacter gummosus]|uniref:Uncharacterized protein n=1 Tax=Hymenobacter gummosus TaxID=1776032 RepID=A0A431U8K7_9BACT|nr:hypothetical protein [Hymenobacter gummosus]RTQ53551.1 hypothetical protein EJV47_02080 [Hymenobacter gummosus]
MKLFYSTAALLFWLLLLANCTKHKDPTPTATVEYAGRIEDYWSGRPVPGATVYLGKGTWLLLGAFGTGDSQPLDSAVTDAQGRFRVQAVVPRGLRNLLDSYGCRLRPPAGWYFPAGQAFGQQQGQSNTDLTVRLERRYELQIQPRVLNAAVDSFTVTIRRPGVSAPYQVRCSRRYPQWPCPIDLSIGHDTTRVVRLTYQTFARRQLLRTDSTTATGTRYQLLLR